MAARFKRAKASDVEAILDTFAALGLLVAFESHDHTCRWARPARAA